jgi:transcriptional regulator with XRE-family HTH domain
MHIPKRPHNSTIGPRLREARLRVGLGLRDAAEAIGLRSHATIHDYEAGTIRVPLDRLADLARAYHCKQADLLKPSGSKWSDRKPRRYRAFLTSRRRIDARSGSGLARVN